MNCSNISNNQRLISKIRFSWKLTRILILGTVDPKEVVGSPQDPISIEQPGPTFDLDPVDAGSSPAEWLNVEIALILHLNHAVFVL